MSSSAVVAVIMSSIVWKPFPHHHSIHFGSDQVISSCWRPAGKCLTIHRCAAIFKPVVPLLNLCEVHSIVTESCLNIPISFHQTIVQFLAKFDAVALLQSFRHFPNNANPTRALNTTSLKYCLPWTDAIGRREKFTHAYKGSRLPYASAYHWNTLGFHKKVGYFSNRPPIHSVYKIR